MEEEIKIDDDNFDKSSNLIDIDKIKKSEPFGVEQMKKILLSCKKNKNNESQNNVSDEDMIKAVWSLYKQYNNKDDIGNWCFDFIARYIICRDYGHLIKRDKNDTQTIEYDGCNEEDRINVYKFFWCLWKLDIKAKDLPWRGIQMTLALTGVAIQMTSDNCCDFYRENNGLNSLLVSCIFDDAKPMDYDFAIWLRDSGYYVVSEDHFYDRLKSHTDYGFSSYQVFEKFINDHENKYGIKVAVESLHYVLKQKPSGDKFFTKGKFINLIKSGKIVFKNPLCIANSEIPNWTKNYVYQIERNIREKPDLKKLKQADKDYWKYMKKQLFGNQNGTVRGLLDITKLEDNDIKDLLSYMFIVDENPCEGLDHVKVLIKRAIKICYSPEYKFMSYKCIKDADISIFTIIENKFKRINFYNLSGITDRKIRKQLRFFVDDLIDYKNQILGLDKSPNKKRFIAGIILVAVGILACVINLLVLGLATKLAVFLFLLSLLILAIGIICLVWEKISDCVRKCGLKIRGTEIINERTQFQRGERKGTDIEINLANINNEGRNNE